jgi:hypothetical protein
LFCHPIEFCRSRRPPRSPIARAGPDHWTVLDLVLFCVSQWTEWWMFISIDRWIYYRHTVRALSKGLATKVYLLLPPLWSFCINGFFRTIMILILTMSSHLSIQYVTANSNPVAFVKIVKQNRIFVGFQIFAYQDSFLLDIHKKKIKNIS